MLDILITILEFAAGWYVGGLIYSLIKRLIVGKDKEIEAEVEAEAIIQMPKLRLESVPHKDQTVYLLNQLPGKFLGQGMSIDEIQQIINKKFAGQNVIIVSEDGESGTIVTVPNA